MAEEGVDRRLAVLEAPALPRLAQAPEEAGCPIPRLQEEAPRVPLPVPWPALGQELALSH